MPAVRTYNADDAQEWTRPGWPALSVGGRDSLVYGTYEPSALTVGTITSEAILLDGAHNYNPSTDNAVTIPNGAIIAHKVIYGDVTFSGTATITDCLLLGGNNAITSGNVGILKCTNTRTGNAVLTDCTIRSRKESDGRDGALGWQFELYRCNISNVVDGVGIYKTSSPWATGVRVKGCYIHDLAYIYPDRDHADGSHNDCIQHQGGTDTEIVGNRLEGTAHYMTGSGTYYTANPNSSLGDWPLLKGPGIAPGSGIIIQNNVGAPAFDSTTVITNNYFHYCKAQFLVKSTADNFTFTGNKFSAIDAPAANVNGTNHDGTVLGFTYNSYWIRGDVLTSSGDVTGLTASNAIANTTNVWGDGGSAGVALNTPRASGIAFDA